MVKIVVVIVIIRNKILEIIRKVKQFVKDVKGREILGLILTKG